MPVKLPVTRTTFSFNLMSDGFKNTFNHRSAMHGLEGFAPLGQRPDPSHNGFHVQLSTGEQGNYPFPHGPVMTEASMKTDILLNQGIQGKRKGLRPPAHLGNEPAGPDQLQRDLQGAAGP